MSTHRPLSRREFLAAALAFASYAALPLPAAALAPRPRRRGPRPTDDEAAIASLVADIRYGDSAVRARAVEQAPLVGVSAIPALRRAARSGGPATRFANAAVAGIVRNARRPGNGGEAVLAARALAVRVG